MLFSLIEMIVKSSLVLVGAMLLVSFSIWFERRVIARMQDRLGPNVVGPYGLLQPFADAIKLLLKEDIVPEGVDRVLHPLAPIMVFVPALLVYAVVPFGDQFTLLGHTVKLVVADVNMAILIPLAVTSLGIYGLVIAGWASNSKYALLGGMRASAQLVSYELNLVLSVVPVVMQAGSFNLRDIVQQQAAPLYGVVPQLGNWYICYPWLTVAFITFFIAMTGEINRLPFDLPEAEQELGSSYHTEYSSMKFAMFYMAEYAALWGMSGLAVTFFLGGWKAPLAVLDFSGVPVLGVVAGPCWFLLKCLAFMFVFVWIRATWPRVRYDHFMQLAWKVVLPVCLANIVLTGIVLLAR